MCIFLWWICNYWLLLKNKILMMIFYPILFKLVQSKTFIRLGSAFLKVEKANQQVVDSTSFIVLPAWVCFLAQVEVVQRHGGRHRGDHGETGRRVGDHRTMNFQCIMVNHDSTVSMVRYYSTIRFPWGTITTAEKGSMSVLVLRGVLFLGFTDSVWEMESQNKNDFIFSNIILRNNLAPSNNFLRPNL